MGGDCETNFRAHFTEIKPPFTGTLASGIRLIVSFDNKPRGFMSLIIGENEYFLSPLFHFLKKPYIFVA
jgi:hypothetical protein